MTWKQSDIDDMITTFSKEKALSERPAGYLLAVLGGALGAPYGLIISPLVLFALNILMKSRNGHQPPRFAAWALAGVIGVPFCLAISPQNLKQKMAKTPPPPPPLSLNQLSNAFESYPKCDSAIPACKVSQDSAFSQGIDSANNLLSTRELAAFTLRVDKIEQAEKGGWDIRGKVTWDLGSENASAATGVGMAMGIATMLGGGTALEGLESAAGIAKDSYKQIGKCLTSTQLNHTPSTEISVALKNSEIPDLNGVKDGAFILIKGTSILGFKPTVGWFDDPASTFSTPTQSGFGEMNLAAQGGTASFAGDKIATKEYCQSSKSKN